jgi:hypothetical protein
VGKRRGLPVGSRQLDAATAGERKKTLGERWGTMGGAGSPAVGGAGSPAVGGAGNTGGEGLFVTFGHGTASAARITELLRGAEVAGVIDIRIAPGSRRHPHVARAQLECWLPESGISYRWDKRLGGFRKPAPDSPDVAWREDMFRGYAGHMRTAGFLAAADEVIAEAATRRVAVMCSESLWWRCHRRLLADFVSVARGLPVWHLTHDGQLAEHRPSSGLRLREDGLLVYDAGQSPLLLPPTGGRSRIFARNVSLRP